MGILTEINTKLLELNTNVWYGMSEEVTNLETLDYIVFFRDYTTFNQEKQSFSDYYTVAIVQENYIPEDYFLQVIQKMTEIKGMKVTNDNINYDYTKKPNTDTIIEIATINFVKARK